MPQEFQFTNQDLPDYFAHQIRDFIRIHWFDALQFDKNAPCTPDVWKPIHLIVGDPPALYSHASVVFLRAEIGGRAIRSGGLSGVLTYPAFRKKGYGGRTVELATAVIRASDMDVALLWTDREKADFYGKWGWVHDPRLVCWTGPRQAQVKEGGFCMFLPVSSQGKAMLSHAGQRDIYVGEYTW